MVESSAPVPHVFFGSGDSGAPQVASRSADMSVDLSGSSFAVDVARQVTVADCEPLGLESDISTPMMLAAIGITWIHS